MSDKLNVMRYCKTNVCYMNVVTVKLSNLSNHVTKNLLNSVYILA